MGIPDPVRDRQFYEGVPIRRFVAFIIDFVLIVVLMLISAALVAALTFGLGTPLLFMIFWLTGFLYRYLLLKARSATFGMLLTGIEIRRESGEKLDGTMSFLHTAGYTATFMFTPLMLIGWFLMMTDPHRRLLHDTFLGTVAINRPH